MVVVAPVLGQTHQAETVAEILEAVAVVALIIPEEIKVGMAEVDS